MSTIAMLSFYPKSGGRAPFPAAASDLLGATGALDPRKASCLVAFEAKDHRIESQFGVLFTRDVHGFVLRGSQPVVEGEGGCIVKAETQTQGGGRLRRMVACPTTKHKGRIMPSFPLLVPSNRGFHENIVARHQ